MAVCVGFHEKLMRPWNCGTLACSPTRSLIARATLGFWSNGRRYSRRGDAVGWLGGIDFWKSQYLPGARGTARLNSQMAPRLGLCFFGLHALFVDGLEPRTE